MRSQISLTLRAYVPTCLCAFTALADSGPENAVIIVDPTDLQAMHVANYYKHARGIPDSNILYMAPGAANLAAFAGANVDGLQGTLFNRHLHNHVDVVILPPGPFFVPASGLIQDGCSPVNRLSISSAYASAFNMDVILDGTSIQLPLGYFSAIGDPVAFDSNITWQSGSPGDGQFARRYFIGAMLGYTGDNGNTLDEIFDTIDRAVAVDATHPEGTFYFMNNTADPARNVRNVQFGNVVGDMTDLGHDAVILTGQLPLGNDDALGILSGFASVNLPGSNFDVLDGAFCDNLTSFGATFDTNAQTKVSDWMTKGAIASAGTVEEPCNYPGKFNHARFHLYYAEGLSIGEAYLRTIQWGPFQSLLYGDPLTRAHTYIPIVDANVPIGPLSGVVSFTPQATTDDPDADIGELILFLNGAPAQTIAPGDSLDLDTTSLDDGFHELRVVAYDDTPVRASGHDVITVEIDNAGGAIQLTADPDVGILTTEFDFTIDDFAGRDVEQFRLRQNGRVVASAMVAGDSATVTVHGNMLGAATTHLQAEAVLAGGQVVRSNRVEIEIGSFAEQPTFPIPLAFDHQIRVLEDQPFLVELPATYLDDIAGATYEIIDAPEHASVYDADGPYRVMIADAGGATTDSFTFQVTTDSGVSNVATVDIIYELNGCNADVDGNGELNILDFVVFQALFQVGDPSADVNGDGALNILDFVAFQQIFQAGCR